MAPQVASAPVTPDGRYLVVRGRLWRRANPGLPAAQLERLVHELMSARRAVKDALKSSDSVALAEARASVQAAKEALGERGPVWWSDGTPDENRRVVQNTRYAAWYGALGSYRQAGAALPT